MAKWIAVFIFLLIFPIAAYAQVAPIVKENIVPMDRWVEQKLGVQFPYLGICQDWKSMPVVGSCQYEWHVKWNDAKFQIMDFNENYYRVYYQGNTFTMDFKRDFNVSFGS
jgi:hypothetical protein